MRKWNASAPLHALSTTPVSPVAPPVAASSPMSALERTPGAPFVLFRSPPMCSSTSSALSTYSFLMRSGLERFSVSARARSFSSRAASR